MNFTVVAEYVQEPIPEDLDLNLGSLPVYKMKCFGA